MQPNQQRIIEEAVKHCQALVDGSAFLPDQAPIALAEAVEAARAAQRKNSALGATLAALRSEIQADAAAERQAMAKLEQARQDVERTRGHYDALARSANQAHQPAEDAHENAKQDLRAAQAEYVEAEHAFRERVPSVMEYLAVLSRPLDLSSPHCPPSIRMAQRFDKVRRFPRLRSIWHRINRFNAFTRHQTLLAQFVESSIRVGATGEAEKAASEARNASEEVRCARLGAPEIIAAHEAMNAAVGARYQAQQALSALLARQAIGSSARTDAQNAMMATISTQPAFIALVSAWMAYRLEQEGKRNTSGTRPLPPSERLDGTQMHVDPVWIILSDDMAQPARAKAPVAADNESTHSHNHHASREESSYHHDYSASDSSDSGSSGCGGGGGGGD